MGKGLRNMDFAEKAGRLSSRGFGAVPGEVHLAEDERGQNPASGAKKRPLCMA